jgi:hypothetical protein
MKDEGADGVKVMPRQFATTFTSLTPARSPLAPSWWDDLVDGTVSRANFRVSSQTRLGMRRVAVLPPEGFFRTGLITTV